MWLDPASQPIIIGALCSYNGQEWYVNGFNYTLCKVWIQRWYNGSHLRMLVRPSEIIIRS